GRPGSAWLSGQVVPAGLHVSDEIPPPGGLYGQDRSMRVLGVADGDDAGEVAGNLDAVAAVVAAARGLAPRGAGQVHLSSATFMIRSRDAARGWASDRRASKRSIA